MKEDIEGTSLTLTTGSQEEKENHNRGFWNTYYLVCTLITSTHKCLSRSQLCFYITIPMNKLDMKVIINMNNDVPN